VIQIRPCHATTENRSDGVAFRTVTRSRRRVESVSGSVRRGYRCVVNCHWPEPTAYIAVSPSMRSSVAW
jgi:hypothetical protein